MCREIDFPAFLPAFLTNRKYKILNVDKCLAPAPTPSRSQANPPKKAKNAFPGGSSCACRG
jgi:hypothetical protein